MATYDGIFSAPNYGHILRLVVTESGVSIPGNSSNANWALYAIKNTNYGGWSTSGNSWSVTINGSPYGGPFTHNFSGQSIGYTILLGSGTTSVTHNSNGAKSISVSASAYSTVWGSASTGGTFTMTTIPRASTPTFSANPTAAGSSVTINTNRADSSFTHTIEYSIGSASGTIATGVGASTSWTPPLSLLNEIPNSTTGAVTITTTTFSGATQIGSPTNVTLNITAPSSVKPTFTDITHSEAVSLVDTEVGAYVQGLSKLSLAIVGAAGAYGSTITSYKIQVGSQTINAASGTTPAPLSVSGTVTITATVTDSRGRVFSDTEDITVLPYSPPLINSTSTSRSDSGGVEEEEGTYIRVDLDADAQSLMVSSTEKNRLYYKISTRQRGTSTWTLKETVDTGGVSFNSFDVVGTYAIEDAWEVKLEVYDKFNTILVQSTIATAQVFMHWGGADEGLGVGKFWERGAVDILGQAYQNDGKRILDEDDRTDLEGDVSALESALDARLDDLEEWEGANRPAFAVRHNTTFAGSGSQAFRLMNWNTVQLDRGSDWDAANSRFVAPVDGLYRFDLYFVQATNVGGPEVFFYKNGTAISAIGAIAYTLYVTASASAYLDLEAGDYIQTYWRNNNGTTVTIDGTRSGFSGYLVTPA